jgi:RNA polymerase sigma factor (sigma-70 family)
MGDGLHPDHPRSLPHQLSRLLEVAEGADQERAWAEFLETYSRLILYVARQTPCDHDVVMDRYAFVVERLREKSCRRLRTFAADGRGKFTTWLMVVARRLCLDHDRSRRGRVPQSAARSGQRRGRLVELVFDPSALDRLPTEGRSPDEELDRQQVLQQLDAAIATLRPRDQLLLTLRYQDERSAREIASMMSLPTVFHVYRMLGRVHDALRQALTTGAAPDPSSVQYG